MTIKYDIKLKQKLILANVQNMEFILKRMLSDIYKIKEYASKDNINQEFIKKLNIEVSRLKKWINNPKDAQEEMHNITEFEANQYWDKVNKIEKNLKLLT
jgi:hypothetical protein